MTFPDIDISDTSTFGFQLDAYLKRLSPPGMPPGVTIMGRPSWIHAEYYASMLDSLGPMAITLHMQAMEDKYDDEDIDDVF